MGPSFSIEVIGTTCLVWIPVAIWVVMLVNWMIVGEIDGLMGVIGIGFMITLALMAVSPPAPGMGPFFLGAAILTLIATPITRFSMDRRALNSIDIETIERAYEMLRQRPDNYAAKLRLARALYNKGLIAHAVAIGEAALQPAPDIAFSEEKYMLKRWKGQLTMVQNPTTNIRCINCGEFNEPGQIMCKKCGHAFLLSYAKGQFMKPSIARKLVACWLFAMMAMIGIPLSVTTLSPAGAIATILLLFACGTYFVVRAFRDDKAVTA